jgi:hypothetical protein
MKYRYYLILAINLSILIWAISESFSPVPEDTFGLFAWSVFFILLIYDIYGFLLAKYFFRNKPFNKFIELSYVILFLGPIIAPIFFTHLFDYMFILTMFISAILFGN